jgi:hypothetical protein
MPAPLVVGAAAAAARLLARKMAQNATKNAVKKAVKTASKSKSLANPKSAVKVKPSKSEAPIKSKPRLGDLPSRGAKPTTRERVNRARDLQWDRAEKAYDNSNEMAYTGLRSYPKGFEKSVARGPGKKNARKREAIRKEANKNLPIKINSEIKKSAAKADARALKAANKPAMKKAPAANVLERKAAKNVGEKIAKNYPNKPRKDAMSMGAQIVQKEGPAVTRKAGKGPGPAQRYQMNSDALKPFPKKKSK